MTFVVVVGDTSPSLRALGLALVAAGDAMRDDLAEFKVSAERLAEAYERMAPDVARYVRRHVRRLRRARRAVLILIRRRGRGAWAPGRPSRRSYPSRRLSPRGAALKRASAPRRALLIYRVLAHGRRTARVTTPGKR